MPAANREAARLLSEIAALTAMSEGPQGFRVRAYESASRALLVYPHDVSQLSEAELQRIKGIGGAIAKKVREYVDTGTIAKLEELRGSFPAGALDLLRVPGVGPKTVQLLYTELGIRDLDDLRTAIAEERLRDVKGLGAKTEDNIRAAMELLASVSKDQRAPIVSVMGTAEDIVADLQTIDGVDRVEYAGSLRRLSETIGDVDILVGARDVAPVMAAFVRMPSVGSVIGQGDKKASVRTWKGMRIDLRVVEPGQFGAALMYFTGSKDHNIRLRERAIKLGMLLNEYGLFETESGKLVAAATEEEVYGALGMQWVPPPMREDSGEVQAAVAGTLPNVVTESDVRGDLHDHSDLSGDGRASLEQMIEGVAKRGWGYVAITDHAEDLRINGASREQMLAQRGRIAQLQKKYGRKLRILHGAELNIAGDGHVDYDADFLAGFDFTVASVHSLFRLDRDAQTKRVVTAIRNPMVSAIGHLSGRRIGKRAGIDLDLDAVFTAAAETGTGIEANSNLDRLDASASALTVAREHGCKVLISTDAHSVRELDYVAYGVRNAQKAWLTPEDVANTWDTERFLAWVAAKRRG